ETLAAAARQCATALGRRLVEAALAATRVGISFEVEERSPVSADIELQMPVDGPGPAWTAVLSLLSELHPEGPVTAVRVEVAALLPAGGRQADLWRAGDSARDAVLGAAGRLRARFGEAAVRRPRLATDPGDLPERRFTWDAPLAVAR
ncbi:MAG: hypothetical protein JOZ92_10395, partial [Candidatus Dormibacteraeota bacterium]|nr:hypothetical protein [Candidatus Dormibacteraeota bacterium]